MEIGSRRVVDLTHGIHPRMPVSIGFPRLTLNRYLDLDNGDPATVEIVQTSLHTGTHVDAPVHFLRDGSTVDELDPLALTGTALVVDVAPTESWREVGRADLEEWERRSGEHIGRGDIVLLRTGHSRYWADLPDGSRYMSEPWPYLVQSSADLLVERGVKAFGVECADPDRVDQRDLGSATFEVHRCLLGAGIPIIENLAHLDRLPPGRIDFMALTLPIRGASASPIRALAFLPA